MELLLPWRPRWERKAEEREARLPARGEKAARARKAEEAVVRWMWKRGFRILARNVRNRFGELDIVAERRGKLIAVEVRSYVTGNPRPSGVISRRKVGRVWRALRRFQKLRHSSLGHLQLAVYVAEAEYSLDGQLVGIRLVSAAPADT
ncbi:MAG: YraN family protein [Armatimonadetes bacterium]|nr:YraN family protein [Armatimonadota bacterium]